MKTIDVLHRDNEKDAIRLEGTGIRRRLFEQRPKKVVIQDLYYGMYNKVAVVKEDDLDLAFELTNHIYDDWWENPSVTKIGDDNYRSTSVGDLMVVCSTGVDIPKEVFEENPDCIEYYECFQVKEFGFEKIW